MHWRVPALLPFGDVEIQHPLAMAPVKPEHNGKQKNEKEDECKGKDKPIFDRCLERRNANLLLIPEKNEVGMVASNRFYNSVTWCKASLMHSDLCHSQRSQLGSNKDPGVTY